MNINYTLDLKYTSRKLSAKEKSTLDRDAETLDFAFATTSEFQRYPK